MIIYCAGPIKGDITYQEKYREIISIVESLGHTALSEFSSKMPSMIPLSDKQIYTRDIKWLDGSKLVIAEISGPSLGVGFEIAYALFERKIPVLALYNEQVPKLSSMMTGCSNPKLSVKKYFSSDDLTKIIRNFIMNNESN
ncbi:MAG: nucleoside 2-deoxyribosyltransferase [Ignavibacteriaceae bacterium]